MFKSIRLCCVLMALGFMGLGQYLMQMYEHNQMLMDLEHNSYFEHYLEAQAELIHELQKERGLTITFIGSEHEKKYLEVLEAQYVLTDNAIKNYRDALDHLPLKYQSTAFQRRASSVIVNLSQLPEFRPQAQNVMDTGGVLMFYTPSLIGQIQGSVEDYFAGLQDATGAKMAISYLGLSKAKDFIGLERAMGGYILASNEPSDDMTERFIVYRTQANVNMAVFRFYGPQSVQADYDKISNSTVFEKVRNLEAKVLQKANMHKNVEVGPLDWFSAMTEKIDLLHHVETQYLYEIKTYLSVKIDAVKHRMLNLTLYWGLGGLVWAIFMAFLFRLEHSVARQQKKNPPNLDKTAMG